MDGSLFSSWFSNLGHISLMLKFAPFNLQFCSMEVDTEGLAVMDIRYDVDSGRVSPTC